MLTGDEDVSHIMLALPVAALPCLCRYREQRDITQPESLNLFLETRFEQLKTACELEMWAEAFRSVEDIQALIALGKRQPKQQMMATYYRCEMLVHTLCI
jgi:translation initiation factor 3 subunit A